jgi:hypothetical protein
MAITTKLTGFIAGLVLFIGLPNTLGAKVQPVDRHDCHQVRRGYVCKKGPLAGQSFVSRKAMIDALRKDSRPGSLQPVHGLPAVQKKSPKAKSSQ